MRFLCKTESFDVCEMCFKMLRELVRSVALKKVCCQVAGNGRSILRSDVIHV